MYGYGNPYYNQQASLDRINNQIKELENMRNQFQNTPHPSQMPTNLTQNFQIAPNNTNNGGVRYANSIEDVKKELVFMDTLFINKEHTQLWLKNANGETKTYEVKEIIELDEKDQKIADLTAKIKEMEGMMLNAKCVNTNDDATITNEKSSNVSNDKPSKK